MILADSATSQVITGAMVLTPQGWVDEAVRIDDGLITGIGSAGDLGQVHAEGLYLLPGIVDLHGDAFERAMAPRPGVRMPLAMAMQENDAAALAAGITTWFCSVTDSFEPGLRSRESLRSLLAWLEAGGRSHLGCDTRLHLRHEVCLVDGHDELVGWLRDGSVALLSWADHVPYEGDAVGRERYLRSMIRRDNLSEAEADQLITSAARLRRAGWSMVCELAEEAHLVDTPCASHDDETPGEVARSLALGTTIAEFPQTVAAAQQARAGGAKVLMGSPNYVRGGSHLGSLSVAEALSTGVLDALCSDYHYPSLWAAPFLLADRGVMPLERAWDLVSANPAALSGLGTMKGAIEPGFAADFLLVQPGPTPRLQSVWVGGREVARFGT